MCIRDRVKTDYEAAQESDPSLAEFLQGLGEDASASADAGTMLTVTEDCNVRASADSEGEVIGGFSAGTEVEKKGQEGCLLYTSDLSGGHDHVVSH